LLNWSWNCNWQLLDWYTCPSCLHSTLRLDLMHICGRTVLIWCVLIIAMDVGCCQPWCIHPCGSWYREGRKRWTSCLEKQILNEIRMILWQAKYLGT
jgi:hypothetical protein